MAGHRQMLVDEDALEAIIDRVAERCAQRIAPVMEAIVMLVHDRDDLARRLARIEWILGLDDAEAVDRARDEAKAKVERTLS